MEAIHQWLFWKDALILGITTTVIVELRYIYEWLRSFGAEPQPPILPPNRVDLPLEPPQPPPTQRSGPQQRR